AEDGIRDRNVTGVQTCALPISIEECLEKMHDILLLSSITDDDLMEHITYLNNEKNIILQDDCVYLASLYYAEDNFSGHIERILKKKIKADTIDEELMKWIGEIEEEEVISYGSKQFE